MINRAIGFAIKHRLGVILAGILLAIWGAWSVFVTPIDAIPDLSEEQVIVTADWRGRSPREIHEHVTKPISEALRSIPGVRVVRASSEVDYSWMAAILDDRAAPESVRSHILARLGEISPRLPAEVAPRLGPDASSTGQIFWYSVEGEGLDLGRLRLIHDTLVQPRLSTVPGVAEVAAAGGMKPEYQVELDPVQLNDHGVEVSSVIAAVRDSNADASGHVAVKANAEFVVRVEGTLGATGGTPIELNPAPTLRALEQIPVPTLSGGVVPLGAIAHVGVGPEPRRGVLEKDGVEVTGGVVLMARGENPREVTLRLRQAIRELQPSLPAGIRVIPFYDRTPLIEGAIHTVSGTLLEAMLTATVCVLLVLRHWRVSLVIASTLPLSVLGTFALLWLLRVLNVIDVQTNLMSLAGIAISIGVLVDSSIVVAENAMHALRDRFGPSPVSGDIRGAVFEACKTVGRPIFFSVLIMLLSFLPVFALGGMEGKMFRPLALTKCLALATVAVLAVTLVPALCTVCIKGRLSTEMESPIVRAVIQVYRPILESLLLRPAPLVWILGATFIVGLATLGLDWLDRAVLLGAIVVFGCIARTWPRRLLGILGLVLVALAANRWVGTLSHEFITPLDEGMVMDMPITVPRASIAQSADDMKARDMILCRFPEVDMVVGKAGRAETATDPAPPDMIETMVNFRPRGHWPKRKLREADARQQTREIFNSLVARGYLGPPETLEAVEALCEETTQAALIEFDALTREFAHQRNLEFMRTQGIDVARLALDGPDARYNRLFLEHVAVLDHDLRSWAAGAFTRVAIEELFSRCRVLDEEISAHLAEVHRLRRESQSKPHHTGHAHGGMSRVAEMPKSLEPLPRLDEVQTEHARRFATRVLLWKKDRADLIGFGGDLDRAMRLPGWTNVWTMPIQNRVDMLATGVNTAIGVRVMGEDLDSVVDTSEQIAEALKRIPGAADVVADPIRGKGYLEVVPVRERALERGVSIAAINRSVSAAFGGVIATNVGEGLAQLPVRVRYGRSFREDEESLKRVLVSSQQPGGTRLIPLGEVARVHVSEGPASIKSESGLPRNYVRLNVRGRGVVDFVADARRVVAESVAIPPGVSVEWTGQFEHEARARTTLIWLVPSVLALIFLTLLWTFRDTADALLLFVVIPGAMVGGLISQWLLGHSFSVTVWVGYIACFGMATSTGIIMMVYLRQAIENAGGLEQLDYEGLRRAVVDGAATRLRPKLLTEGTTVLALAPMLWASGVGAEVIRPMAAPVLGGILFADEVIDLLIPILFHAIRRRRLARIRGEASTADLQSPHHEPSGEAGSDDSARAERRETEILGKRG
jgi:Cu(I)/Ag(I) efflux system membrane protein CusA/SilA